jgi:hypothetical protein
MYQRTFRLPTKGLQLAAPLHLVTFHTDALIQCFRISFHQINLAMSEIVPTRPSIFCADFLVCGKGIWSAARSGVAAGSRLPRTEARAPHMITLTAALAFREYGALSC